MKPVIQQDPTGCGIACVATLARITYKQAKGTATKIGISHDDHKLWSETDYVRKLLAQYKIKISTRQGSFKGWDKLPDCALLAIKWHVEDGASYWHWTVFVRERKESYVLDPAGHLKNNRRTDFRRMKPKWFIEVYRP